MHPGSIPGEASSFAPACRQAPGSPRSGDRNRRGACSGRNDAGQQDHERRFCRAARQDGRRPDAHDRRDQSRHCWPPCLRAARRVRAGTARAQLAYIDEDIEICAGAGRTGSRYLMEPSPFAKLLQLAEIRAGDFVLDVGGGTGYSAAVLSRLAGSVVALESDPALAAAARAALAALGCDNVTVVEGRACRRAMPAGAPYDVILVERRGRRDCPSASRPAEGGRAGWSPSKATAMPALRRVHVKENGMVSSPAARLQCGSQATTGIRTCAGIRILSVICRARIASLMLVCGLDLAALLILIVARIGGDRARERERFAR